MSDIEDFHYDIGYYEGIRNILQIINTSLGTPSIKESERIDFLLKWVTKELKDAKEQHEFSQDKLFGGDWSIRSE
jgi:hypothetical protein